MAAGNTPEPREGDEVFREGNRLLKYGVNMHTWEFDDFLKNESLYNYVQLNVRWLYYDRINESGVI